MSNGRTQSALMRIVRNEHERCELCGSGRDLQVHHIIPVVLGGPDVEENLIVVCAGCHAKLTPHGLLSSMGIERVRSSPFRELQYQFYKSCDEYERLDFVETCDILDATIDQIESKYNCTFRRRGG